MTRAVTAQIRDSTLDAVKLVLKELQTDYVDLMLIHSQKLGKEATIQIWKGLIAAKKKGLVRAIGVSNMNGQEILDLETATGELPEVNQIQFHPWTSHEWKELVKWQTMEKNIATTAYTSLGGSRFHQRDPTTPSWPPIVTKLAKKYDATESQVLLRWALRQNGVAVIPGATSEAHISENLHVPKMDGFSDEEAKEIEESEAPKGWFDERRGPVKYSPGSAKKSSAWKGDHTINKVHT